MGILEQIHATLKSIEAKLNDQQPWPSAPQNEDPAPKAPPPPPPTPPHQTDEFDLPEETDWVREAVKSARGAIASGVDRNRIYGILGEYNIKTISEANQVQAKEINKKISDLSQDV